MHSETRSSARVPGGTRIEAEEGWNLLDPDVLRWMLERKFSLDLLAEFTEIRLAIEPTAAVLAAQNPNPEGLAQMSDAIERMRAAALWRRCPLTSDIAFHVGLLHATGNRFYTQLDGLISAALRTSIRLTNRVKGVPLADVTAHRKVLDAIFARNPRKASDGVMIMLQEVMDLINVARRARNSTSASRARRDRLE